MTNGEKMQEMFPEGKTRRCRGGVVFESDGWCHAYDSDWWNTEHKEPTTKNNLTGDCISRDSAIKALDYDIKCFEFKQGVSKYMDDIAKLLDTIYETQVNNIKALSSVTPQEPRWIPCSERMPEEDTDVLVTLECGLIGIVQKKLADDDNGEPCYIWQDFEGEEHEVIAWMPLPQPYSEVTE